MKKRIRTTVFLPGFILIFICILMMKEQEVIRKSVSESLAFCAYTVIPSLFPFTVLSLLLTSSSVFSSPMFRFLRPFTNLLRLPQKAIGAILCGFLCGFPLGAASVSELYETGELSSQQANRLLALSNNTGPAFIISLTGSVLFGNLSFGVFLYILQIVSALLIAAIVAKLSQREALPLPSPNGIIKKYTSRFAGIVTHAAGSMLSICAMIVLFRVFAAMLSFSIPFLNNPFAQTFLCSVLECTSGATSAAALGGLSGAAFAGFSIGWSGISVLLQCQLFIEETDLSMKICFISKLIQGLILALGSMLFFIFSGHSLLPLETFISIDYRVLTAWEVAILGTVVFLGAFILGHLEKRENKKLS